MEDQVPSSAVSSYFNKSQPQYQKSRQLVDYHAYKYAEKFPSVEVRPLQQAGWVALWEATQRFDPRRGVDLTTFANKAVKKAILKEIQVEVPNLRSRPAKRPETFSLRPDFPPAVPVEDLFEDQHPADPFDDRVIVAEDTKKTVEVFLGTLSPQQRRVAEMVRAEARPVDVAAELDISRARVSTILARIGILATERMPAYA